MDTNAQTRVMERNSVDHKDFDRHGGWHRRSDVGGVVGMRYGAARADVVVGFVWKIGSVWNRPA